MSTIKTISSYFDHAIGSAIGNLGRRGDSSLMGVEASELLNYYCKMYEIPEITLSDNGEPQVIPEIPSRKHEKDGHARVKIRFDVEMVSNIEKVLPLTSSGQSSIEQTFEVDDRGFYTTVDLSPSTAREQLDSYKKAIGELVNTRNREISNGNMKLSNELARIVKERKARLKAQEDTLKQLSEIIPLKQATKPSAPIVPLKKKYEIKINPPQARKLSQPKIDPDILTAIIDILVRGGKTFEAAPKTFEKLDESDLRNILISYLNGNFNLRAAAEAFNKLGKTDISLLYSGNNLFVAECKFWSGSAVYMETIDQLFGYLTWRESVGVVICFVRERDFTSIIDKARSAAMAHPTYIKNSYKKKFDSYFITKNIFPDDKDKVIEVHHLLFSIFVQK